MGTTASRIHTGPGIAASNLFPIGAELLIESGSMTGTTVIAEDRVRHGSELDIWSSYQIRPVVRAILRMDASGICNSLDLTDVQEA